MSTRERILSATIELFRAKGYQGTSLAEVASNADATIGSLYHFFPGGKAALAAEALLVSGAAYQALFDLVAAESGGTAADAVGAFFDGAADALEVTDFVELCPIGSVSREMAGLNIAIRDATSSVFKAWIDHLSNLLVEMDVPETDVSELAITIIASLEGSFGLARATRDANIVRTTGTQMRRLLEATLAAEAAGIAPGVLPKRATSTSSGSNGGSRQRSQLTPVDELSALTATSSKRVSYSGE